MTRWEGHLGRVPQTRSPAWLQSLHFMFRDPVVHLEALARRHGDVFLVHMLVPEFDDDDGMTMRRRRVLCCATPSSIEDLLVRHARCTDGTVAGSLSRRLIGPESIFRLIGTEHTRRRRWLNPALAPASAGRLVERAAGLVGDRIGAMPAGRSVSFVRWSLDLCMDFAVEAVYGVLPRRTRRALSDVIHGMVGQLHVPRMMLPVMDGGRETVPRRARMDRLRSRLRAFTRSRLEEERRCGGPPSERSILEQVWQAAARSGHALDWDALTVEALGLVIAAYETPAASIAWTGYWVARHPRVQSRLRQEARAESPDEGAYLQAVLRESLRITPPACLALRRITHPVEIGGSELVPGDYAFASFHLLHRNPAVYRDPMSFRPERFLDAQPGPFEFLPFGAGARTCAGRHLGFKITQRVIGELVARRRLRLDPRFPVRHRCLHLSVVPHELRLFAEPLGGRTSVRRAPQAEAIGALD